MSLQPSTTSLPTQPYLHFSSIKNNNDGRPSISSLEKTHLSKNDVIRLVMDKDKPVFPVKAKFDTMRSSSISLGSSSQISIPPPSSSSSSSSSLPIPSPSTTTNIPSSVSLLKRKRELLDEKGVEEEVARNVSRILSASRLATAAASQSTCPLTRPLSPPLPSKHIISYPCPQCNKVFTSTRNLHRHRQTNCITPPESLIALSSIPSIQSGSIASTTNDNIMGVMCDGGDVMLPSNLITPDLSSYESSPPSENPSVDGNWVNGLNKDDEGGFDSMDNEVSSMNISSGMRTGGKICPDCGKVLCSSSNLKRHRSTCKYGGTNESSRDDDNVSPERTITTTSFQSQPIVQPVLDLPKWSKTDQPWVTVGEHLKAQHLGQSIIVPRNTNKEEWNRIDDRVLPTPPLSSTSSSSTPIPTNTTSKSISPSPIESNILNGSNDIQVKSSITSLDLNLPMDNEIQRTIALENPFACTVCYKNFSCRKNVRRHMMAIHKVAPSPGAPLNTAKPINISNKKIRTNPSPLTDLSRRSSSDDDVDKDGMNDMKDKGRNDEVEADSTMSIEGKGGCTLSNLSILSTSPSQSTTTSSTNTNGLSSSDSDPLLAYFDWGKKGSDDEPDSTTNITNNNNSAKGGNGKKCTEYSTFDLSLIPPHKRLRLDCIREDDRATLVAQGVKFNVSRSAAMKSSPYLAAVLVTHREIEVDVLPAALQNVLLIFGDHATITVDNIVGVSEVAFKLKFIDLKTLCERFISEQLPQYSMLRAIRLADTYRLLRVKDQLLSTLDLEIFRTLAQNIDYQSMRCELKAELLEKWGSFL